MEMERSTNGFAGRGIQESEREILMNMKTVLIVLTGVLVSLILAAGLIISSYLQASHSR